MDVELPNGKVIEGVPEGTSKTEIMRKAVNAGLATYADFGERMDPTEGMSGLQKFAAGYGKATMDAARGVGQLLTSDDSDAGRSLQASIDESRRRDAPLMQTGAGTAGNLINNIVMAAPTAAIPGANTVLGSAVIGGAMGALQPTASNESVIDQAGTGALFGAAGQVAGRAIPSVVKAAVSPFYRGGRERLAGEVIERFAENADDVMRRAGERSNVPGINYSLAEATQDPGIAILQRGAQSLDPTISGGLTRQGVENIDAARAALQGIGGDDAAMEAAQQARAAFARTAYDAPNAAMVEADDALRTLMERPSMSQAWERARRLAAEAGETLVEGRDMPAQEVPTGLVNEFGRAITRETPEQSARYSGRGLHYLKMAMDNLLSDPSSGIAGTEAAAVRGTRNALVDWLGERVPGYNAARQGYAAASRPINQMEVGRALYDRMTPALADSAGAVLPRTRAESYANALRNADTLTQQATDFPGARFDSVMSPEQQETIYGIRDFLARRAAADELGRGAGSNTAQNLVSQNIMRQIIGPLGLPESWGESVAARMVGRGVDVIARPAETAVQEVLVEALRNPQRGAELLQRLQPSQRQQLAEALYRYALPGASIGSGAYAAGQ